MSSRDRLEELRQLASGAGQQPAAPPEPPEPPAAPDARWQHLDALLEEVEQIREWLLELALSTRLIARLHADPTYHASRQLQEQLDAAGARWGAAALKASGALRQLGARAQGGGAAARAARLHGAALRRRFADALAEQQRALQLLRDDQLRLLHNQMRLTNAALTDEECERLLDANHLALFVDNVQAESVEARRALRDAELQREELARAEAALRDVRDLFQQLAHLVAAQQDQIDSVEYFALQATEHVESGGQQLLQGSVRRRGARKKKIALIVCLVSGFLVVLLVLVAT